ncbi:MAG TPA: protein kinase [Blastocatellia bacterium]|nr:protein kinase [Blastocatellia bacterium]
MSKKGFTEDLESGTLLNDRYQIVKRIGGGGMGSVYQARDRRLSDRLCAVKEMIQQFSDENQQQKAVEDFLREAQLLASLDHPSIPTIFDYFIEGGRYYLVMYYIQGRDFEAEMERRGGTVDELTVTQWAIQTCDVLAYIHEQNPPIIYRDMKPANLMLDERRNKVMLIDFGIARFVAPTVKGVTAIGTMGYRPPELFSGKVEPRSDIYSLGATMFHMLTGVDPQDNPLLIFDFTKHQRPRQIRPSITHEMDAILVKMVAHKPEERHASSLELKKELEDHERMLQAPASGSLKCTNCKNPIHANDAFCANCGAPNPAKGGTGRVPEAAAPSRMILTTVDSGTGFQSFAIDKSDILLGRADPHAQIYPEVDLTMHDSQTKVSRRHARIFKESDRFFVEDLGSANGTTVNGGAHLQLRTPYPLNDGDVVKLGETSLRVTFK